MDSKTNDYDVADGNYGTIGEIVGDYKTYYEDNTSGLKRYVVIENEDGISAHRVYLAINQKLLRPANNGLGFGAIFAGDQVVTKAISENGAFGIQFSGYSDFNASAAAAASDFAAGIGNGSTPNQRFFVAMNVISESFEDAKNQERVNKTLYGRPYITIGDTEILGNIVQTRMCDLIPAGLESPNSTVSVQAMLDECRLTLEHLEVTN